MRISVVSETCWTETNNIAITLQHLTTGLINKGHELQLIYPEKNIKDKSRISNKIDLQPVKNLPFLKFKNSNYGFPSGKRLLQIWQNQKPDIIYVTTQGPLGWAAIKEAKKQKIPTVSYFNTNYLYFRQKCRITILKNLARKYLINLLNKTNTTIVSTVSQKKRLLNMGINNIAVLDRGVDTNLFTPQKRSKKLRHQWGVKESDPVMLYIGRIDNDNNLDLAIRTYFILHSMNKKLKFVLVGDGPLARRLKSNHPDFIFSGMLSQEALAEYYASADLLVFPGTIDTYSNVILEAMASGLGIITYNYAAAHIHIKSGENGLLAIKNDSQQFISNAKRFLRNDLLLKNCRINASNYAKTQDWHSIFNHFEDILYSNVNSAEIDYDSEIQPLSYKNEVI